MFLTLTNSDHCFISTKHGKKNGRQHHLIFEKTALERFLERIYPRTYVKWALAEGIGFELNQLVKRQLIIFALEMDRIGLQQFLCNSKVHRFFVSSNRKVLTNVFNTILVPIAARAKMMNDLRDTSKLRISQVLEDLPIKTGKFSNAADRLEYILSGIVNAMLGRTIFFRQLLQGMKTLNIFEHPNLTEDFSEIGIVSIKTIDRDTIEQLRKYTSLPLTEKHVDAIIHAYSLGIRFRKSATFSQNKQGNDLLVKFDLTDITAIMNELHGHLPEEDMPVVETFLRSEKEPKRIIKMEMKTTGGYPRNLLKNLYDLETSTAFRFGADFLRSHFFDLKGVLDNWNSEFPYLQLDVNQPRRYLDPTPLQDTKKFPQGLTTILNTERRTRSRLIKSIVKQDFLKRLPEQFIEKYLIPYLETLQSTTDAAILEEWLRSGNVIRPNMNAIIDSSQQAYSYVKQTKIQVITPNGMKGWICLRNDKPPFRIENNQLVFGPDLVDETGRPIMDNPFKMQEPELKEILNQAIGEIKNQLPWVMKDNPAQALFTTEQIKAIQEFINRIEHFESVPDNIPPSVKNLLIQYLKDRLIRNPSFGLPDIHVRTIKGYGNHHFHRLLEFLSQNRFISPDMYDEFILTLHTAPNIRPRNSIPLGTEEIFAFVELLPPSYKAYLEIDNWTFAPDSKPISSTRPLQPRQINTIVNNNPKELTMATNINPQYGALFFRKPVGLKKVHFPTKKIHLNTKIVSFTGSLFDLSRFNVVPTDASLQDIAPQWREHTFVGTNAKGSLVKALMEAIDEPQNHNPAMELIYFGDTKTAIGAYLAPLFDLLDTPSKQKITAIAKKHATTIATKLKEKTIVRSIEKGKLKVDSTQFQAFQHFKINHNNAILWYVDAVMEKPKLNANLKIRKGIDVLAALTFDPTRISKPNNSFRITQIMIVKKVKTGPTQAQKLLQLQKGILTYEMMLLNKARTITKNNLKQIRTAFTKLRTSRNKPYQFSKKTLQIAPSIITPSNIIKAPSGQIIPFTKKFTPYYFAFDRNHLIGKHKKTPKIDPEEIINQLFLTKQELQKHLNIPMNTFLSKLRTLNNQKEIQKFCQLSLSTKKKHK